MPDLIENVPELLLSHGYQTIAPSHPVSAIHLNRNAHWSLRYSEDKNPTFRMTNLVNIYPETKLFTQARTGALLLREGLCACNLARPLIGYAKDTLPPPSFAIAAQYLRSLSN